MRGSSPVAVVPLALLQKHLFLLMAETTQRYKLSVPTPVASPWRVPLLFLSTLVRFSLVVKKPENKCPFVCLLHLQMNRQQVSSHLCDCQARWFWNFYSVPSSFSLELVYALLSYSLLHPSEHSILAISPQGSLWNWSSACSCCWFNSKTLDFG